MHNATTAYAKTAQKTAAPRELEAQLLLKAAAKIQMIIDGTTTDRDQIFESLRYNRRLWTILISALMEPSNPLPREIKQNLVNLGIFQVSHTLALEGEPDPNSMGVLVNINRRIAEGLRMQVGDAAPATPAAASA
jgi:flagellar protein FlaF